jgi:glycosyltransferase involved in cell wall biosynthesis
VHVGLNLLYYAKDAGGTGTYARMLIPALLEVEPSLRLTLFTSSSAPPDLYEEPWAGSVNWVRAPVPGSGGAPWTFFPRTAVHWGVIPLVAASRGIDVVHGPAYVAPIVRGRTATVVSVHDLIWLHDRSSMTRLARTAMRIVAPPSIRAADHVITGSAYAAADIRATLGLDEERVTVVVHGPGELPRLPPTPDQELRKRLGLGDGPLVLAVGQRRRHKNLTTLIEAFALLERRDARLVFAGAPSEYDTELRATAERAGVLDRTALLGWVDQADLEGLYASAVCLVLPSLQEGFGLTIVEAMARGVPVACSSATSLPDTSAGAALLFDPADANSIANALRQLLTDGRVRDSLIARGLARTQALSWRRSATETLAVYAAAIESRRRRGAS